MLNYLKRLLDPTDQSASSRRFISLFSFLLSALVIVCILVLAFKVALETSTQNVNAKDALAKLLELLIIVMVFVLLMNQIITWQNVNDTARILTSAPGQAAAAAGSFEATIEKTKTTLTGTNEGPVS